MPWEDPKILPPTIEKRMVNHRVDGDESETWWERGRDLMSVLKKRYTWIVSNGGVALLDTAQGFASSNANAKIVFPLGGDG